MGGGEIQDNCGERGDSRQLWGEGGFKTIVGGFKTIVGGGGIQDNCGGRGIQDNCGGKGDSQQLWGEGE